MERVELEIAVDAGLSIAQLAERFGRSKGSVRYWLGKYGLKTLHRSRRDPNPALLVTRADGLDTFVDVCPKHGETEFVIRSDGGTRCKRCRSEGVVNRRRRVKEMLVAEAGGQCSLCGYNRYVGALAFHHVDPTTKLMGLASKGRALSIKTLREEAQKCVLLCHNCHAEVEAGLLALPIHLG